MFVYLPRIADCSAELMALEILLTLVKEVTLPFIDAAWISGLPKSAAGGYG